MQVLYAVNMQNICEVYTEYSKYTLLWGLQNSHNFV